MNNQYEPLGNDNFSTAPDHSPAVNNYSYFQPPSNEKTAQPPVLPPPPPPPNGGVAQVVPKYEAIPPLYPPPVPESSEINSLKSQEPTDLRSEENKSKLKNRKKTKDKKANNNEMVNLIGANDAEKQEETARVTLRLNTLAQQQEMQAKRIKTCVWATTAILLFIGIILTAILPTIYFTDCFTHCQGIRK